jgi:hypothetical protein
VIYWQLTHWTGSIVGTGMAETIEGAADEIRAAVANLPLEQVDSSASYPEYRLKIQSGA